MGVAANRYKKRLIIVCLAMILMFTTIVGALFYWQIIKGDELQRKALGQWSTATTVSAQRGNITDINGETLAISALSKTLVVKPKTLKNTNVDINALAKVLATLFSMEEETILKRLTNEKYGENTISRHLTETQISYIEAININGLSLIDDVKRYYPKGNSLAQVLGSTTIDGVGREGLELKYDKYLRGLTGKILSSTDVGGGEIPGGSERYIDPANGVNLRLTVDYAIQTFAENALKECMEVNKAKKAQCIVMNPKTGAILAMVNLPDYDLNEKIEDVSLARASAVLDVYEPGSTFKIFTLASAVEEGVATLDTKYYCPGYHIVDGQKIKCWRTVPHGSQTLTEAVCNSCNPAFMQMGLKLGQQKLYEYLRKFGFDAQTGIDFSSEQSGILMAPKYVKNTDLARISFGQSVAVTPLQLLTAACAVINGGTLYQPHFIDAMLDDNGTVLQQYEPVALRQVISETTSKTVKGLLEAVVSNGSGKNAQVEGYNVGGKTGTAQKYRDGVIISGVHVASFLGFAPVEDPQVAVLVVVDEPQVAIDFGSVVAAPYAGQIMEKALKYLRVTPSVKQAEEEKVTVPNLHGYSCTEAEAKLKSMGLQMLVKGKGTVISQIPAAGETISVNSIVMVEGDKAVDSYNDILED